MATDQLTHFAEVKIGKIKGNSRTYPKPGLRSQYKSLVGKASVYEMKEDKDEVLSLFALALKTV